MLLHRNPQLDLAFEYVNNTNAHVFLTGKAGTGKTTFLQRIRAESAKRLAVVAPTGVAAINAGGMTIHSLFQLPFGPFLPGNRHDAARQRRFSKEKINLIRSLDLLVIDEISMVRADVLDGIDDVLRRYRDFARPFGGLQLLMIGDLHQLPPVAKDDEWQMLRAYYDTPYFFSSQALRQAAPVVIELKHIYRQSDSFFIDLLNRVRERRLDAEVLDTLNSRYVPDFRPADGDAYITLSTHNATAQEINAQRLSETPGTLFRFRAEIHGDFPAYAYPTEEDLALKVGAQVMFVKNDISRDKRYYNGKIGKISAIKDKTITVQCPGESETITVAPVEWQNLKYSLNAQTKSVTEDVAGTFTQLPLRLAWAITIHKSQGLTFEKVILDAQSAFAHGQVYVALSRCKSFEGIVLRSRISASGIKTDSTVQHFSEAAAKNEPDEAHLHRAKAVSQQVLLEELFQFAAVQKPLEQLRRAFLENEGSLHADAVAQVKTIAEKAAVLYGVANKFRPELQNHFRSDVLPEGDEALQGRVRKGAAWFADQIGADLLPALYDVRVVSDNREVRKTATEALEAAQAAFFVKHKCFEAAQKGFSALGFQRCKADAELDFNIEKAKAAMSPATAQAPQDVPHPKLFQQLKKWRTETGAALGVELFQIVSTRTLLEIVQYLPGTPDALKAIKGIGKAKLAQFGADILAMVQAYCAEHHLRTTDVELPGAEKPLVRSDTKVLSFELFRSGKTIDEIAAERGFVRGTIEGHLAHFVESGELDVLELIDEEDASQIGGYLVDHPEALSSEVKAHFGDRYSYSQIKLVMADFKRAQAKKTDGKG